MLLDDEALLALRPGYIVLDEFHRAGAKEWGGGVRRLLRHFPEAPVLGLSATNIRYLDNRRDMADELFDGNVASEMTLGEALALGILRPPKYVTALFQYQNSLAAYERRAHSLRNRGSRDRAEQILEKLRRALEHAVGLPELFQKHLTNRHGKYLVFCASKAHMDEMISHVPEWFRQVDPNARVYSAYSDDPETSRAFAAFKNDGGDRLKLLFCINMLNEGVHVEDVDGVILFRPTVSPIIYKQQIGRALCAGSDREPVILDIVDNLSSLYSVGAIQEEIQAAITYYHFLGQEDRIVVDGFRVIDEVRDVRSLFDELEAALTVSWDRMYAEARRYARENGDLDVPSHYRTADGLSLGRWLFIQKQAYRGKLDRKLTARQIRLLEALGIRWESRFDLAWSRNYAAAKAYYEQNGSLNVPPHYITPDGVQLGIWVQRMRSARANQRSDLLTPERIRLLDELGICWDTLSLQWEQNYAACVSYYKEHGDLDIPARYVSPDGLLIGQWIGRMRSRAASSDRGSLLTEDQIRRLDQIGMIWDVRQNRWQIGYRHCQDYRRVHGDLRPSAAYVAADGFKLGQWLEYRRRDYAKGRLDPEKIKALDVLGILWNVREGSWEASYREVCDYLHSHGSVKIPRDYRSPSGKALALWLERQFRERQKLTPEQAKLLDALKLDHKEA